MASPLHPLPQLEAADLAAMDLVGAVGEAQRARVRPPEGERKLLTDAATAVELHGALDDREGLVGHRDLVLGDGLLCRLVGDRVPYVGCVEHEKPSLLDLDAPLVVTIRPY